MNDPNRLHPDGAPGEAEAAARRLYGDVAYESWREFQDDMATIKYLTASARLDLARGDAEVRHQQASFWWMLSWTMPIGLVVLLIGACLAVVT